MNEMDVRKCVADAIGVDLSLVGESFSAEIVDEWDSLKHLILILALEDKFYVSFTEDEVVNMLSYVAVKDALLSHGVSLE